MMGEVGKESEEGTRCTIDCIYGSGVRDEPEGKSVWRSERLLWVDFRHPRRGLSRPHSPLGHSVKAPLSIHWWADVALSTLR